MSRRASPLARRLAAGVDARSLVAWLARYLEALRVKNYSPRTVENRERYVLAFAAWCEARSVTRPEEVTKPMVDRYQRHLFHYRSANGKPLTYRSQIEALTPLRGYFKWLARTNVLLCNPASELELPRPEKRLPKHVLTAAEAERVLLQPDVGEALGVRDRAILETLYSTGIRRREATEVTLFDIDQERGTLMVRQGKGKKDRMVPIGERAVAWIRRYLDEVRPSLVLAPDPGALFLTLEGEPLGCGYLTERVSRYVRDAELGKTGSCHLFRHTCATLMLEGGADIRYIQEMLGHEELSTTQLYTRVSIRRLKAVHALTHPSAKLERPEVSAVASASPEERAASAAQATTEAVAELMTTLSVEADEEDG
jgi:integrase/recombinase XerD